VVRPGVQFKAIEGDPLSADRDYREEWPHLGVEAIGVHAQIARRIAQPIEAGEPERGTAL